MRIRISTEVKGNYLEVFRQFERPLFEKLKPAGVNMKIIEFTGSRKGDKVHIQFLKPVKGEWISMISDDYNDEKEAWFIDEGTVMPFGIKSWKHKHIISKLSEDRSLITDDIVFKANVLLALFLYLAFYFTMWQRKKIYRNFFGA